MSENLFNNPVVISAFKEVVKSAYKNNTCIAKEIAIAFDSECNCAYSSCHDCKNKVLKQLMRLEAKTQNLETKTESVEPIKPRSNEEEYLILKELFDDGYNYITRDRDESLYAYEEYPYKNEYGGYWNDTDSRGKPIDCTNFKFIKWEDDEATSIEVLLAEYENAMKLNEKG